MEQHSLSEKIDNLRSEVSRFAEVSSSATVAEETVAPLAVKKSKFAFLKNFSLSSPILYPVIVIVVFMTLLIVRPGFVRVPYVTDEGEETTKMHFKKVLIFTLVFSVPLIGLLIFYNVKYNKKS